MRYTFFPSIALLVLLFTVPAAQAQSGSSCNTAIFDQPGSYTYTVPSGVTSIAAKLWGGAGGSGTVGTYYGYGGAGGFSGGTIPVTPGETLSITVAGGGASRTPGGFTPGGFGGGGNSATYGSSGGGGMSAIFAAGSPLLIAGGGGGGVSGGTASGCIYRTAPMTGCTFFQGGAGGALTGQNASAGPGVGTDGGGTGNGGAFAQGGTQTAGGAGGGPYTGESGSSLQGGNGLRAGAGGGGGYFGGGAGGSSDPGVNWGYQSAGGGGSSYLAALVSGGTTQGGSDMVPGNASDASRPWGVAEGNNYGAGGNGVVILSGPNVGNCAAAPTCAISLNRSTIENGTVQMTYSSTGASQFYIEGVGWVPAAGTARVPNHEYNGYVNGPGGTATCSTSDNAGSGGCVPGRALACGGDGNLLDSCGNITPCAFGCSATTNACHTSCQSRRVCNTAATSVVNSCDGNVIENCADNGKICVDGVCIAPQMQFEAFEVTSEPRFSATGHLQVRPSIVRPGQASTVFWKVAHARSCTVQGTNGDSWTGDFSGSSGMQTGIIQARTTYTLHCVARPGATPPTLEEQQAVDIIPIFQEL